MPSDTGVSDEERGLYLFYESTGPDNVDYYSLGVVSRSIGRSLAVLELR